VSLYHAIMKRGTRPLWAKRLGLAVPRGAATAPLRWSDEAIDRALGVLLQGRESWPTGTEFATAGCRPLYQAIARSPGGHDCWARRYGLPRPTSRRAQAAREAHARRRARAQATAKAAPRAIGFAPETITPSGGGGAGPSRESDSGCLGQSDYRCSSEGAVARRSSGPPETAGFGG
jgi:hypothetical protein